MCSSHVHDIFLNVYLYLANKIEIKGIGNKEKTSYSKDTRTGVYLSAPKINFEFGGEKTKLKIRSRLLQDFLTAGNVADQVSVLVLFLRGLEVALPDWNDWRSAIKKKNKLWGFQHTKLNHRTSLRLDFFILFHWSEVQRPRSFYSQPMAAAHKQWASAFFF